LHICSCIHGNDKFLWFNTSQILKICFIVIYDLQYRLLHSKIKKTCYVSPNQGKLEKLTLFCFMSCFNKLYFWSWSYLNIHKLDLWCNSHNFIFNWNWNIWKSTSLEIDRLVRTNSMRFIIWIRLIKWWNLCWLTNNTQ
jgi:hypothetical protein